MKLAACSATLPQLDRNALLSFLADCGIGHLELGVGGYPGTRHASARQLRDDPEERRAWFQACHHTGIELAALACHGNPLHPDPSLAEGWHQDFMAALEAANALHVPVVVGFSGQPGTGASPNWPVVAWPDDYARLHEQQWQEQLIPYWQTVTRRAAELGVTVALEMHGGFAVHSPATLLRLRGACGPHLAANLDPSHLWWQGIDPVRAAQRLGSAVAHVHLKDTVFNTDAMNEHGLLDLTPHNQPFERAWRFGVPGEGHDAVTWNALIEAVSATGYRGVFSIEHEAPLPAIDGIRQCAGFMQALPCHQS